MKYLIAYTFQAVAGQTGAGNTLVTFSGPITEQRIDDIRKSVNEANDGKFALVVITNIMPLEDGQASQQPAGYKLVPTEPTDEMLEASPHGWKYDEIAEVYRAMITAATSGKEGEC